MRRGGDSAATPSQRLRSVVLSRPGTEVLAVQILRYADDGLWGKLAALGIVMIAISTGLVLLATAAGARFRSASSGG